MSEPSSRPIPPAEFRVLLALVDGPKHGHGIKLDIRDRTDGRVDMGPGTLYGAIKRLVERGWITEVDGPDAVSARDERRRFYRIADAGRTVALAEAHRMQELLGIARAKKLPLAGGT